MWLAQTGAQTGLRDQIPRQDAAVQRTSGPYIRRLPPGRGSRLRMGAGCFPGHAGYGTSPPAHPRAAFAAHCPFRFGRTPRVGPTGDRGRSRERPRDPIAGWRSAPDGAPIRNRSATDGAPIRTPGGVARSASQTDPVHHRRCGISASKGDSGRTGPAATTAAARARAAAGCLPSPKPDARPAHVETRMKSPRQGGGLRGRSFKFAARTFLDNVANRL